MILNIWVKYMNKRKLSKIIIIFLLFILIEIGSYFNLGTEQEIDNTINNNKISYEISNIPKFNGEAYIEINNNNPNFTTEDINIEEDYYSKLKNDKVRIRNGKNFLEKSK